MKDEIRCENPQCGASLEGDFTRRYCSDACADLCAPVVHLHGPWAQRLGLSEQESICGSGGPSTRNRSQATCPNCEDGIRRFFEPREPVQYGSGISAMLAPFSGRRA